MNAGPLDLVRRSVHRVRGQHDTASSRAAAAPPDGWRERLDAAVMLWRGRQYVLFVSHMRSYSTLLGHIFGSHPEISGYAELHRSYQGAADLREMRLQVWRLHGNQLDGRFVFDKLLHRRHEIGDDILRRSSVFPIYALREPIGATKSLVAMGRRLKGKRTWHQDPRRAANHALNRYADLVHLADRRPDAAAMFTDCLVSDQAATLDGLTDYLGLHSPLTPEYEQFDKTAKGGFGDPMGPISAGHVVADRPEHDVEIPDELQTKLLRAYEATSAHLLRRCRVVIGSPSLPMGSR